MMIAPFDWLTRNTASLLITGYQKHLSPYKGFSCAHRVLYGGDSCSQFTKRAVLERGITAGLMIARDRFQACKAANKILKSSREESPKQRDPQSWQPTCADCSTPDCTDLGCETLNCLGAINYDADCGSIECGGCDGFSSCS